MNYMQGDGRGLGGGPPPPRPTSGYIQHQHLQGHQHHQPPHLGGGMQGPHHGQQQHPTLQQQHHAYQQQQAQHQPPAQHHPPLPSTASSMSHHHGMGSNGGMGNNLMGSNGGLGIGSSLDDDQLFKQFLKQDTGSSGVVDLEYDGDDAFQKMEEELMNNDYLFDAPIMQMPPVGADALSNPPSAPLSSGRSNGQQQTASGTYHNQGEMYPPASRNKGFDPSNSTSSGPSSAWGTASNETSTTSTTATSSTSPSTTSTTTTSTSPSSTSTTTTGSPPSSSQQQPAGQGAGGSRFQRNGPAKSEDDQQDQDFSMGMALGSDGTGPQGSKQQPGPSGATNASASAGSSGPSSGPPSGNAPQLGSSTSMGQPAAGQQQQPPAQGAGGGAQQSQLQQQQQLHLQQQQQLHQQQLHQQQQLQQHQQQQQQQHPRDLQQLQQHHQQQQQQLQQQHQQQQQQLHQHQFQQHQQQLHHMQQQQRHQAAAAAAGRSAATAPSPPSISTPSSGPTPPAPAQPTPPAQSTSMGPGGGPGGGGMMLPGQQMGKWKGAAHHQQAPPTAGPGSNGAPVGGIPSSGPASGPIGGLPPQPQQQPGPAGGGLIRSTSYDAVTGQMKMGGGGMDPRMVGAQGQVHPGMQRNPYHAYGAYGPPQGQQHGAPPHLQQQSQPPQPSGFAPHMQPPPQHAGMTHVAVGGQPPNAYFAMQRNPTRTMSSPHMSLGAGGPGQPQPPQPTGYGGQFHPGQAAQPGGPMYEGGPHPSSGYPSSAYYGRSGGGEPVVARNGEGGAAPVFSPQFQMQVRSQHMRRLNQALGQQVTPGGPVAGGPTGPAPSPGGQSGPAMVTTPGGPPLAASSMPSPAGPGQVGADAVGQQQLSHVTTPGGTQSAGVGGGVPSSATTVGGPIGGLPPQASAPGGVGHPGMGGYPAHPGMMAKRPPGGMGMVGGPQHPGGPQTALVSGQGQQQPGGQGQPGPQDNNVGPGAMVGVPGGPGGPGVMPPNVGVPRSDLALSQFKEVWENLGMYRNFLFQLVPINPSALLEANVKYILATPEGAAIRTPLSLSVYVVMALGSLLRANFRMTREFANKAHEHLVHTLEQRQSIDYTLGQALLGMAYIEAAMETVPSSSKWKQFYAELAMKICKRLGAYSSILYFHSMFFISCDPTISLERLIQMQREGNQTPDLPYHTFIEPNSDGIRQAMPVSVLSHGRGNAAGRVLINVINGLNIHMKSSQLEHSQHAAAQQPGGGGPPPPYGPPMGGPPPHHGAPPPLSPAPGGSGAAATIPTSPAPTGPSPSPLAKPMSPASHFGSWTAGPTAMSMPVGSTGPVTPASAAMGGPGGVVPGGVVVGITGQTPQPPTMPPYFDSTSYFYQLMESMDKLEKELRVIQTTADPLPTYAYFTFCLCIYSLHAACCWRMGMKDKALFWAKKFLSDSHKEEWRSCCGGPPMQEMIGLVLNIFLQMNELESLDFQLNQIERLLVVYPALNAMVTHFQKVLWEKKEQQLIMQKRRQMYIQQQQQGGLPGPMSPHHPLASPPPMAIGMGMPMHPSAGVGVPHGPMAHHMGGHHLPGQGQPLPSHVPQMSPHQPQMSPQQQQQMAAQMTPPQPQAQEGASTGEMSPPGAKGKGGRGGRANRGRVGASAAAATKSRSGSSTGVGTPGQTSTSGDGTPSNQTPNQPSPISTTTPTTVVPQPSPSGAGAPARGRAAKQQQQGARGSGGAGGKQATRSKKRERDERDEMENGGGGGGGGGVNGERGGIKLEEQTEERERKREREDNDSNLMRETATSSAPDSLQTAITSSSSQASQDDDGSTSAGAGAGIKSEQSGKLERMDEQQPLQINGNGSMNNAGGLLGAMMGLENGGMGLGMGPMGDAGFGGGPLMPPFSNGSFDAASLSLSLEDPFLEPELESGWWENL